MTSNNSPHNENLPPVTPHGSDVDYHCHILPGLDDGAQNIATSLQMARLLAAAGFREVCCTPHRIKGVWDTSSDKVRSVTAALQTEIERAGIPLTLHPGMEYYLDEFLPEALDDPLLLPGGLLLVELPARCDNQVVQRILAKVVQKGLVPLIAHPERCHLLELPVTQVPARGLFSKLFGTNRQSPVTNHQSPLHFLQQLGCQFQGNLGSLRGHYGARAQKSAFNLDAIGCYTHWGSDAHNMQQLQAVLTGDI